MCPSCQKREEADVCTEIEHHRLPRLSAQISPRLRMRLRKHHVCHGSPIEVASTAGQLQTVPETQHADFILTAPNTQTHHFRPVPYLANSLTEHVHFLAKITRQ